MRLQRGVPCSVRAPDSPSMLPFHPAPAEIPATPTVAAWGGSVPRSLGGKVGAISHILGFG